MSLDNYWPSIKNIGDCIATEAEELSEKLLLAVHEPMLLKKVPYGGDPEDANEDDFFEFFIDPSRNRPIPVLGQNGTGKSHLVRWVEAKIKLLEDKDSYHVIRIPKSASLAKILYLILDRLEDEEFVVERNKIAGVGEKLIVNNVVEHLLLKLNQRLDSFFKDTRTELDDRAMGANNGDRVQDLRQKLALKGMQILFRDPVICQNFITDGSPFYNIAKRICGGASSDEIESGQFQLNEKDFSIIINTDATKEALQFIQQKRLCNDQRARERIAELVNQFIDDSYAETCAELCNISRASFSGIFENIRKHLLKRGKTLVVLVEDLSGLTGIQGELLTSLLLEGRSDGEQVLCNVKSIIAVTNGYDGYVSRRGMICSRVGYEWELASDNGIVEDRIISLCSKYINAARLGQKNLDEKKVYLDKHLEDEDKGRLDAFGSSNNIPLFPFNRAAILKIATKSQKLYDSERERYRFVPREIIKVILDPVLKSGKKLFEEKNFPPPQFLRIPLDTRFLEEFKKLATGVNPATSARLKTLISIWGGELNSLDNIDSNFGLICESFGLPNVKVGPTTPPPTPPTPPTPTTPTTTTPPPIPDKLTQLLMRIDDWFDKDNNLNQDDARVFRNAIAAGYNKWVNYEDYGFYTDHKIKGADISIPRAEGQRNISDFLIVSAGDKVFRDDSLKNLYYNQVKAILRFNFYNGEGTDKKGWKYNGGETDYIHYANFFDSISPRTIEKIKKREFSKMTSLVQSLLISSRILNIEESYAKQKSPLLISTLFAPFECKFEDDKWREFKQSCLDKRTENIKKLKRLTCASKDIDTMTLAVNSQLILKSFESSFLRDCRFDKGGDTGILPVNFDRSFNAIINELNSLKNILKEQFGSEIKKERIEKFLESDLADLKKQIVKSGQIVPNNWESFKCSYKYCVENKEKISQDVINVIALNEQYQSEYLKIVASIPLERLDNIRELIVGSMSLFNSLEGYLVSREIYTRETSIPALERSIIDAFTTIVDELGRIIR